MEAIILAGGIGSRLKSITLDNPKCLAKINNIPFIDFIIKHLLKNKVEKIIFSLGYKSKIVIDYLNKNYTNLNFDYCVEIEPLGTGGALKLALAKVSSKNVIVVNGDTFLNSNLSELFHKHIQNSSHCTFYIKQMNDFNRYGTIDINKKNEVISIVEKKYCKIGLINTGQYVIDVENYIKKTPFGNFSFEVDFLEKQYQFKKFYAFETNEYFIDIGIPEDFEKAQIDLMNF